ncbi:hypothetical protein LIPSTDRAFT_75123 [Lipomyces starkeyi NRRL Y-11557]|uniref:Uncharacterized protein n=1 Tax=Lipomyces starkeyi NRRL Y-11557 TaxID=675824 RepID=A0A1E3PXJ9_LIPST|nr:hypothetical protein LIPSTDRAFT_75123 [Lipomyces starkeyi NRRL Y-11557]
MSRILRTRDRKEEKGKKGKSTARCIKTLGKEGMVYRVKIAADNTLESLVVLHPDDIAKARL